MIREFINKNLSISLGIVLKIYKVKLYIKEWLDWEVILMGFVVLVMKLMETTILHNFWIGAIDLIF